MNELKKEKRRLRAEKAKLPKIELKDLWGLDTTLAGLIAVYLREFIDAVEGCGATPASYCVKEDRTIAEDGWDRWHADLEKMASAFEEYKTYYSVPHFDDRDYAAEERIKEGMKLFFDNYRDLNY